MTDEPSFVRLAEDMGTALLNWARSSSSSSETYVSPDNDTVVVSPDSTLVFDRDKPQLDLELPRLARILANASAHAGSIYNYLDSRSLVVGDLNKPQHKIAVRQSVTIRDSLFQLSRLVAGEDLDEEFTHPQIDDNFLTFREAEIYHKIKHVQSGARNGVLSGSDIALELEVILEFIRGEYKPAKVENNDDS